MHSLISILIIALYIFIFSSIKVRAEDIDTINVLITRPDIDESNNYLDRYNKFVKDYILSKKIENSTEIPNVDIKFSYCNINPLDGETIYTVYNFQNSPRYVDIDYVRNSNCTITELKNSNYDLVIIDEKLLYSDISFLRNIVIEGSLLIRNINDYFEDFNHFNINNSIKHHDDELLKKGYLNNSANDQKYLFGLPYELDYDLIYYYDEAESQKDLLLGDILRNKTNESSKDFNGIISVGLKDTDELMNTFVEYICNEIGLPPKDITERENSNYYEIFYKNKKVAMDFYKSFKNYVQVYIGSNVNTTLSTSIEDAYQSFINKEKMLFKGKASYYALLKNSTDSSFSVSNLPKKYGITNGKYLTINNNSKKLKTESGKENLIKAALLLTSKDFQFSKAEEFGTIPTISMKNENNTNAYCNTNPYICEVYNNMTSIDIHNIFNKNIYSANFLEVRIVLPRLLIELLKNDNYDLIYQKIPNFLDSKELVEVDNRYDVIDIKSLVIYNIATPITIGYLIYNMVKVNKNKKHPYLKAISPQLSNLAIIGLIMKTLVPYYSIAVIYLYNYINNVFFCQLSFVLNFFFSNLTYLPILAIIFRIYYIYTNVSKVNFAKKLKDNRLIAIIFIALGIVFIGAFVTSFLFTFSYTTFGSFAPYRYFWCFYFGYMRYLVALLLYNTFLFTTMFILTIKIHKISKNKGDIKFIFFIVTLLFATSLFDMSFGLLLGFRGSFIISFVIYLVCCCFSVDLLVGYRLRYIKKHPIRDGSYNGNSVNNDYFDNAINLVNFIPLMKDKNNNSITFSIFNRSKRDETMSLQDGDDPIEKNPNNYFFNRTLKMLNQQKFEKRASI